MKDTLTDANFPRTADLRVYHLGLRPGEVANRIITVGSPSRAQGIARFLDARPKPFVLSSERGFLTITGRYHGMPVSIVSIGMGHANMDFFVREVRECLVGDMIVVRLGSCGSLVDIPVGSVAIPKASVAIVRDVDFDFSQGGARDCPYKISREVYADPDMHRLVKNAVESLAPADFKGAIRSAVNASADSFYSSQGRQTSFPDFNQDLIPRLLGSHLDIETLEMETFHLYHLASCWTNRQGARPSTEHPPLTTRPVNPIINQKPSEPAGMVASTPTVTSRDSSIKAAAVHMIFASRTSQDFITPDQVAILETWTSRAVLEALHQTDVPLEKMHIEKGSVWELDS